MYNSPYPPNGINGTLNAYSYPSPAPFLPHHGQPGSPLPQTLPPLQPSTTSLQLLYGSNPHTPRAGTPNTPNSAHYLPPSYPQSTQAGARGGIYSMPQNPYPPHTGYGISQPMMHDATTTASFLGENGVGSPYGPGPMIHTNGGVMGESEQPIHVVGSQGRRGILPSAPGRPAAPAAGTLAAKNTVLPVKDTDGKFPCPHCTKTYLHAKHLRRHLLRHTGDRPYMCVLCRDAFSRSDVLKRHFEKCSDRRGNRRGMAPAVGKSTEVKDILMRLMESDVPPPPRVAEDFCQPPPPPSKSASMQCFHQNGHADMATVPMEGSYPSGSELADLSPLYRTPRHYLTDMPPPNTTMQTVVSGPHSAVRMVGEGMPPSNHPDRGVRSQKRTTLY